MITTLTPKTPLMKTLILTLCSLLVSASTYAAQFADADFFGGTDQNGNPNGILLDAGGRVVVDTSFNFISNDGTPSFTLGSPYDSGVQGTYSSALGYIPGTAIDASSLSFTFFFRDPSEGDGAERINLQFGDLVFNGGSFTGTLVTSFGGNAEVLGDIQANGFIMYRVRSLSGEFIFDGAIAQFNSTSSGRWLGCRVAWYRAYRCGSDAPKTPHRLTISTPKLEQSQKVRLREDADLFFALASWHMDPSPHSTGGSSTADTFECCAGRIDNRRIRQPQTADRRRLLFSLAFPH